MGLLFGFAFLSDFLLFDFLLDLAGLASFFFFLSLDFAFGLALALDFAFFSDFGFFVAFCFFAFFFDSELDFAAEAIFPAAAIVVFALTGPKPGTVESAFTSVAAMSSAVL